MADRVLYIGRDETAGGQGERRSRAAARRRRLLSACLSAVVAGLLWSPPVAVADSWAAGPNSTDAHVDGVSVELPNGQVLLAGGGNGPTASMDGQLLAADGSVFAPAGTMTQGRQYAAATLLQNGKVLIAGGVTSATDGTPASATAELWSPVGGGSFSATGSMHVARQVLTLTTLPNGQALAVGGSPLYKSKGPSAGSKTAELYNPATGKWTLTGSMPSGRLGHTATLLPNCKVLIVGDAQGAVTYNYVTGKFSPAGSEGNFQRSYQTATLLPNGKVLIAGGETVTQVPLKTASLFNPATNTFTATHNQMSAAHSEGFGSLLSDGRVLVGGGTPPSAGVSAVDIYNPSTDSFSSTASLPPNSFAYHVQVQTLRNGEVAVMGAGPAPESSEIFTPATTGSASPPAQSCSDLFSILSVNTASQGKITLRVGVPSAGSVKATATAPAQTGVPKPIPYGSSRASLTHWGPVTLTISPNSTAGGVLRSKGTLKVNVSVAFTATHEKGVTRKTAVTAHWS